MPDPELTAASSGVGENISPPAPMTGLAAPPFRAIWNRVLTILWLIVIGYLGVKVIAGAYFVIFELYPPITRAWHATIANPGLRHDIRDVAEGYYATFLAQAFVWNRWKSRGPLTRFPPFRQIERLFRQLEHVAHIPAVDARKDATKLSISIWIILTFVYAVPGFFAGRWAVQELSAVLAHFHATTGLVQNHGLSPGAPLWSKEFSTLTSGWPKKVIGVLAALFFGRRPATGLYENLQIYAARRRVASGRRYGPAARLLLPPGYIARCDELAAATSATTAQHALTRSKILTFTVLGIVNLALFGVGEYVLLVVATP